MARTRLPGPTLGLLVLLAITAKFNHVNACDPVDHPAEGDNAMPNFLEFLKQDFTMLLEMTYVRKNITSYVQHSYYVGSDDGVLLEEDAVTIHYSGALFIYRYFPQLKRYIEQFDDTCIESERPLPEHVPVWWFDDTESHGAAMYGPAAILRAATYEKARYDGNGIYIDGINCEKWYVCMQDGTAIHLYFSSRDAFDMPQKDMFPDDKVHNRIPVMFEVVPDDVDLQARYSVVDFVPHLMDHSGMETPRGLACENKISIEPSKQIPRLPQHMSWAEESIVNPFIDGIMFGKHQYMDKFEISFATDLSMTLIETTPRADEKEDDQKPDRIIHDFNTGVEYAINRKYGKCERGFIPQDSYDVTSHGAGGFGVMATPDQLFHLDDSYAFVGERDTRGLRGDIYTSIRKDIPDPEYGGEMPYPKAVLEYYFSKGLEVTPSGKRIVSIPTRDDLFIYNKTIDLLIAETMTTNYYDVKDVGILSTDEYSVNECFDRYDDDWSTLLLFFPADEIQFAAQASNQYLFKDQIFFHLLAIGDISPTRIGSIDFDDGTRGWYANTSDTNTIMVTVKLMERAPYLYGYRIPDEPMQAPGDEERGLDMDHLDECAELCTLETRFQCKSFHFCKDRASCYLSDNENSQGAPLNFTCSHFIDNHENQTFDDVPSIEVEIKLLKYIGEDKFTFNLTYQKVNVTFKASEAIMFKTPDPLDPVRNQFSLYKRYHTIKDPDAVFTPEDDKSLTACFVTCISWIDFRCETVVHNSVTGKCSLFSQHVEDMNETRIEPLAGSYIHTRNYLNDYKFMLGGVSVNTTGPVVSGYSPEFCAWKCTKSDDFNCNSFEFCWETGSCHLHVETFMDVSDGGNYSTHQKCIHFDKKAEEIFTRYPNEGLPNKDHKLVAQLTDISACAKLCLQDSSETCQSYDFCDSCDSGDFDVCGSDNKGGIGMCFLGDHHIGEPGLMLMKSDHCEHYSRDLFGDQDYAAWVASQRKINKPYTGGSMAGLAFGMIFLGIMLSISIIFILTKVSPGTLPESISLSGGTGSSLPSRASSAKVTGVSFENLTANSSGSEI